MPRWVLVDDVEAPALTDDDAHHLTRVLRLRPGDAVDLADGAGRWRPGRLTATGAEPDGEIVVETRPTPTITVAVALTKGERPEVAVQKLTELGVDRIIPFEAARSVARWDAPRAAKHVARLRKVAREAAVQSRRAFLPEVTDVTTFEAASVLPGAALADREGDPPSLAHPTLLVGPEGGWVEEERASGLASVRLGPHVLRAETAAMAAGWTLVALRSGLVRPGAGSDLAE